MFSYAVIGRNTANKYHWHVWKVLTVYGPHWACPSSWHIMFPCSTLLRLQVALQGICPKQALGFVHFPDLSFSGSGSQVLFKGIDSVGHSFCALPRFKQLRLPGSLQVHCPRWAVHLNHLPGPRLLVSQMRHESTISSVPCVSLLWGADLRL